MKSSRRVRTDRAWHEDVERLVERSDVVERMGDLVPLPPRELRDRLEAVIAQYPEPSRARVRVIAHHALETANDWGVWDPNDAYKQWVRYLFDWGPLPTRGTRPSTEFCQRLASLERFGVLAVVVTGENPDGYALVDAAVYDEALDLLFRQRAARDRHELLYAIDRVPDVRWSSTRTLYNPHEQIEELFNGVCSLGRDVAFLAALRGLQWRAEIMPIVIAALEEPWVTPDSGESGPDQMVEAILTGYGRPPSWTSPINPTSIQEALADGLRTFAGSRRAAFAILWHHVKGSFRGCPFSIPDLLRESDVRESESRFRLLLADDQTHEPALIAHVIAVQDARSLMFNAEGVHRILLSIPQEGSDGGVILPIAASILHINKAYADTPEVEQLRGLVEQWLGDYLRRLADDPPGRTEWDTWVMTLRDRPRDALVWHVFADWLDERSMPEPASVARGQRVWPSGWEEVFMRIATERSVD